MTAQQTDLIFKNLENLQADFEAWVVGYDELEDPITPTVDFFHSYGIDGNRCELIAWWAYHESATRAVEILRKFVSSLRGSEWVYSRPDILVWIGNHAINSIADEFLPENLKSKAPIMQKFKSVISGYGNVLLEYDEERPHPRGILSLYKDIRLEFEREFDREASPPCGTSLMVLSVMMEILEYIDAPGEVLCPAGLIARLLASRDPKKHIASWNEDRAVFDLIGKF